MKEYHNNLSRWFRQYIIDLTSDIDNAGLWTRYENINSPGWTLMHLITEGELALKKMRQEYENKISMPEYFIAGSDGSARSELSLHEMHRMLSEVYSILEREVIERLEHLNEMQIDDYYLEKVLKTELDFQLHMLTTHIAMHCDAIIKWRLNAGMELKF